MICIHFFRKNLLGTSFKETYSCVSAFERRLDKLRSNQSWKYNIEDKPDIIYN